MLEMTHIFCLNLDLPQIERSYLYNNVICLMAYLGLRSVFTREISFVDSHGYGELQSFFHFHSAQSLLKFQACHFLHQRFSCLGL